MRSSNGSGCPEMLSSFLEAHYRFCISLSWEFAIKRREPAERRPRKPCLPRLLRCQKEGDGAEHVHRVRSYARIRLFPGCCCASSRTGSSSCAPPLPKREHRWIHLPSRARHLEMSG